MLDAFIDEAALTRRVWMAYAQLTQDAQSVIAMRLWGQAGAWTVAREEGCEMMREKPPAFTAAMVAATYAAIEGQSAIGIAGAAIAPISETARENRARLAQMGPRVWSPDTAQDPNRSEE
jgi:hypothetical protein